MEMFIFAGKIFPTLLKKAGIVKFCGAMAAVKERVGMRHWRWHGAPGMQRLDKAGVWAERRNAGILTDSD